MIETAIIDCLLISWGIIALVIFKKLRDDMKNPDSKWWNLIGIDKSSLRITLWIVFIVVGFVAGVFGISFAMVDFPFVLPVIISSIPIFIIIWVVSWILYRVPPPLINYRRL